MAETFEKMYANLHFHSTHSDGIDTPETLAKIAKEEGYGALCLTDHDTNTGLGEMKAACEKEGLEFLTGCEFYCKLGDIPFHIVGMDFDPNHPNMLEYQDYSNKRWLTITKGFFDLGLERGTIKGITWDEVVADNPGVTTLVNDHVFRTMKKKGLATDKDYDEFFRVNYGFRAPFDNPYKPWSVQQVFDLIHSSGGIVIFAHPGYQNAYRYFDELLELGFDGVEVQHPDNVELGEGIFDELYKKCENLGLYVSGGTDHSGLMGGQYAFFDGPVEEGPHYIPSLKYGAREVDFRNIQKRIYR